MRLRRAVAFAVFAAATAGAQTTPQASVRVLVVDSTSRPIAGADVSIVEGLSTVLAHGITDSAGGRVLAIPSSGQYQVVVRRFGFFRSNRFFTATASLMSLRVQLASSPASLPTVAVTANADSPREHYHLDADDIAASSRPLFDGLDVLTKLRPDIIDPRVPSGYENCHLQYIWVNGQRVTFVADNERVALDQSHKAVAQQRAHNITGNYRSTSTMYSGITTVPMTVLSVLASIHPEHIAEVNYTDCNDMKMESPSMKNAVFVSLKPGIKFEAGVGSYIADDPLSIVANRLRLVGVYDDVSGDPVAGVQIVDSATGTFITTSETGSAHLAFLADGMHTLRIRKPGYVEQSVDVIISATDQAPLTLTLRPLGLRP
jgi:hypothetical protein